MKLLFVLGKQTDRCVIKTSCSTNILVDSFWTLSFRPLYSHRPSCHCRHSTLLALSPSRQAPLSSKCLAPPGYHPPPPDSHRRSLNRQSRTRRTMRGILRRCPVGGGDVCGRVKVAGGGDWRRDLFGHQGRTANWPIRMRGHTFFAWSSFLARSYGSSGSGGLSGPLLRSRTLRGTW